MRDACALRLSFKRILSLSELDVSRDRNPLVEAQLVGMVGSKLPVA